MFHSCVQRFQSLLLSKTKELTELMERDDPANSKLRALQVSPHPSVNHRWSSFTCCWV